MQEFKPLTSENEMISLIRTVGMIPFSKCPVTGWSIQEMTSPDFWFTTSDQLGPWDWRIEALHDGLIYGKFLSRCSAFATEQMYRHLMNWRRSLPKYKFAEGARIKAGTIDEKLNKYISPILLSAIRSNETCELSELRHILEREVPVELRKKVGGYIGKHLIPKVDRQAVDFLMGYLDMGTWTVVADITRVYRGPNCEYKGWQRNSVTTPDLLLKAGSVPEENEPFWARFIDGPATKTAASDGHANTAAIDCSPQESREFLLSSIRQYFPDAGSALEKLIDG